MAHSEMQPVFGGRRRLSSCCVQLEIVKKESWVKIIFFLYSVLGYPLGYVMWLLYLVVDNFGWAVILFTVVIKAASFPLTLKQQKNMAYSQLFTPRVQEAQKKYRGNQQKLQEEMQKLQKEGYNPMGGCAPMILTMILLFGIIDVVYKPMTHMERFDKDTIQAIEYMSIETEYTEIILQSMVGNDENRNAVIRLFGTSDFTTSFMVLGDDGVNELQRERVGAVVRTDPDKDLGAFSDDVIVALTRVEQGYRGLPRELRSVRVYTGNADAYTWVQTGPDASDIYTLDDSTREKLDNLKDNMYFWGMNLGDSPNYREFNSLWLLAAFCVLSSIAQVLLQQFIQKKSMPESANVPGGKMLLFMGPVISLFIVFNWPAGAGLYWAVSSLVMMAQSAIIYKFWPPDMLREQAKARAGAKNTTRDTVVTTTATVTDADGDGDSEVTTIETKVAISDLSAKEQKEYFRKKLEEARKADLEKYGEIP